MKISILLLIFLTSCSSIKPYYKMKKEDIQGIYTIGEMTFEPEVKINTSGFLRDIDYLKKFNRDPKISCFQDGDTNIINYLEYTSSDAREYIRHMFFNKYTTYEFRISEKQRGKVIQDTTILKKAIYSYKVLTKSCLLLHKNGNAFAIMTDKIIYVH